MKIGIEIRKIFEEQTGVEKFLSGLLKGLSGLDKENEYFLFTNKKIILPMELKFKYKIIPVKYERMLSLTSQYRWYKIIQQEKIDIFFTPVMAHPLFGKTKKVITVHDFCWAEKKYGTSFFERIIQRFWYKISLISADAIVTTSETVRKKILENFPRKKIFAIGSNISDFSFEKIIKNDFADNLNYRYFLAVGTIVERKNYLSLLKAFKIFLNKNIIKKEFKLVIAGKKAGDYDKIKKFIEVNKLSDVVELLGYISDKELYYLYSNAFAFINVSISEGFGIPLLEAANFGLPIICSEIEVFKEVTEGNALFVNPVSENDIAAAMIDLIEHPDKVDKLKSKCLSMIEKNKEIEPAQKFLKLINLLESENN